MVTEKPETEQKVTHTPGPWEAKRGWAGYCIRDLNGDGGYVSHASFVHFGRYDLMVFGEDWDFGRKHSGPQSDYICANAYLIAAAPDLLAACKRNLGRCWEPAEDGSPNCDPNHRCGSCEARAAIAKAEGRSDA
jgi:hypothetical protein